MATIDYVEIPSYATRLRSEHAGNDTRPSPKIVTSLPRPEHSPVRNASPASAQPMSPSKAGGSNLTSMLLSSALQLPANAPSAPRTYGSTKQLLSTRDPLSIPITTVNFRRFVSKAGPIFWLQDRIEEIVLWKKGWKYTSVWMAAYAFFCFFPRLILLIPHVVILGVLLTMHPVMRGKDHAETQNTSPKATQPPPPSQPGEGSVDWLANLQAIQNLMGAVSDGHDLAVQYVPYLTWSSPYTGLVLSLTFATLLAMIPLVNLLPMRATCLVLGLAPLLLTHPYTQHTLLPTLQSTFGPPVYHLQARLLRLIDDDNLEDRHWRAELREVELYENERWTPGPGSASDDAAKAEGSWSKTSLKQGERKAWTRGRDGWSGVSDEGSGEVSSNLTFSLSPGWYFVETEDWRPDLEGTWVDGVGADEGGWVYTNDVWLEPQAHPLEEWKSAGGMTRRRRWTRRIYYSPTRSI